MLRFRFSTGFLLLLLLLSAPPTSTQADPPPFQAYLPVIMRSEPPLWMGPFGGSVVVITPDPTNGSVIYAGTWGAGVYKSTDAGVSWSPARSGLWNLYINSMAVDPRNGLNVYAGTYGDGIFKSTDGGASWVQASNGLQGGAIVYAIAIDPENPNRLYAATRAMSRGNPPWSGIVYKSENGGASWRAVLQNIGGANQQDWVYSLAVLPRDPNFILAAAHEYGVYRSLNYGDSWSAANNGITDFSGRAVVFDPRYRNPSTAFYGVWHRSGLFKTTTDANLWRLITDGIIDSKIYSMGLAIDPNNPNRLFAATFSGGVLRSTNSGESWSSVGFGNQWVYSVAVNPANSNLIYAGLVSNGLYRSTDGGNSWAASYQGLSQIGVSSLVGFPGDPASLIIGAQGVLRTTNLGASWAPVGSSLPADTVNLLLQHPQNPRLLFALTQASGLYRINLNTETTWSKLQEVPPTPAGEIAAHPLSPRNEIQELLPPDETDLLLQPQAVPGGALLSMAFAPSSSNIAYLGSGGNGVYRSTDGGSTWSAAGLGGQTVWGLAVDPANPSRVFAATSVSGTVKLSENAGASWVDTSLPGAIPYTLAFSPDDPGTLFAATSKGVFSKTGNGEWSLRGLSGVVVTAITPHPSRPGWIFAGSNSGAYFSTDGGNTWNPGPAGLEWLGIKAIVVDPNNPHYVYYCTASSGVFRAFFQ
ncbi:MAG TPA: hypothetical protein DEQ80_11075 [Anaerolinea thermolimosa]|mgnify:CR=1 FL=1|uniref:Sortilin N-terminal domain-containing protein n=1 Tax=Anaerolinea thermolimosa TaxID=229919 RepID=A0A3D1JIQ7_9CHLR|nr:hypothetical protein [Anaerolinea thermolimosa]GAP05247.1 BNR/Asp-box repeat [Anaerolinea thermolimosa]HCE18392.1 hypothetical protein [Anaerolinea thermolimosa]